MTRLVLALMLSGMGAERPAPPSQVHSAIRVYQIDYRPALVTELQHALTRLLEGSGFGLTLIDCTRDVHCQNEPDGNELVLRLMPGHNPNKPQACGIAHPDAAGNRGVFMTIFVACVSETTSRMRSLAARRDVDYTLMKLRELDVLAPIVVHETLHLLLPGEEHGLGLWKGALDQGDLERAIRGRLKLESKLAARARAAAIARYARQRARR